MKSAIRQIKQRTEKELESGQINRSTWHDDFRTSAYIVVSGLNRDMNEGDISVVFSQFGEITDIRLVH